MSSGDVWNPIYWEITNPPYYNITFYGQHILYPTVASVGQEAYSAFTSGMVYADESKLLNWMQTYSVFPVLTDGMYRLATTNIPPIPTPTPAPTYPITGCFIATAAYGTSLGRDLDVLRRFRDEKLPDDLVDLYYRYSPHVAKVISRSRVMRWMVRQPLKVIVWILSHS